MSTRPFHVHVAVLRRTPGARLHEIRSGRIEDMSVAGTVVPPDAEVSVDAVLEMAGGSIVVTATVSSDWVGECRRCLGPVTGVLEVAVREVYEPPVRHRTPQAELSTGGQETYPLAGDTIDLLPMVRDAILLDLPLAPLCRPDCAGLCPTCGADRNLELCGCSAGEINPAWAALDALRTPDPA